jgi:hypothetical protein
MKGMIMRMENAGHTLVVDDKGDAAPRALTTSGTRLLMPVLRQLEIWEEAKLSQELFLRFGMPKDCLGFKFRSLVVIRRLRDPADDGKRFEIRSTYAEGSPLVIFYQSGRRFFYEKEETCKTVW